MFTDVLTRSGGLEPTARYPGGQGSRGSEAQPEAPSLPELRADELRADG